jgi:hypothetical protein
MDDSSPPRKQQLFTLHGIRDSAGWQSDVSRVFLAEFEHIPLRYREYHLAGACKMFLWPWALLSAALVTVVWLRFYPLQLVLLAVILLGVACVVCEWWWSGRTAWLAAHSTLTLLAGIVWFIPESAALLIAWLLFASIVFVQELRELQCDNGPSFGWWPLAAGLFVGAALIPIYRDDWIAVIGYGLACVAVAYWEAHRRRACAFSKVVDSYQRQKDSGSRAQWAAHSFGTYLTCRLLSERPTFARFDHMVIFGAIAPADFNWHEPLHGADHHPPLVNDVRNEFGYLDWAVPLATKIRCWGRRNGYGRSGIEGFNTCYAHLIDGAFGSCQHCADGRLPIHNVSIVDYEHGSFLKPIHFRQLWLPYFWGYPPDRFEEFLQLCNAVAHNLDDQAYLDEALPGLMNSPWLWSPQLFPSTTGEWLEAFIVSRTHRLPNQLQLEEVVLGLCQTIVDALDEFDAEVPNQAVLRCLKPPRAATAVVKTLINQNRL